MWKNLLSLITFKGVFVALIAWWWLLKLTRSSLLSEAFRHQLFATWRIRCSTFTILQRERTSSLQIQVESTVLLAWRRQRFWITSSLWLCDLFSVIRAVQAYFMCDLTKILYTRINKVPFVELSLVILILLTKHVVSLCFICSFVFKWLSTIAPRTFRKQLSRGVLWKKCS